MAWTPFSHLLGCTAFARMSISRSRFEGGHILPDVPSSANGLLGVGSAYLDRCTLSIMALTIVVSRPHRRTICLSAKFSVTSVSNRDCLPDFFAIVQSTGTHLYQICLPLCANVCDIIANFATSFLYYQRQQCLSMFHFVTP